MMPKREKEHKELTDKRKTNHTRADDTAAVQIQLLRDVPSKQYTIAWSKGSDDA